MTKIEALFAHDFERTPWAKMHRILSNTLAAHLCALAYRLKRRLFSSSESLPASHWLLEHMQEFVQQRLVHADEAPGTDLLQLMINAFHNDRVMSSDVRRRTVHIVDRSISIDAVLAVRAAQQRFHYSYRRLRNDVNGTCLLCTPAGHSSGHSAETS
jgi:hypothetical protein